MVKMAIQLDITRKIEDPIFFFFRKTRWSEYLAAMAYINHATTDENCESVWLDSRTQDEITRYDQFSNRKYRESAKMKRDRC